MDDFRHIEAIRKSIGYDVDLMVDASSAVNANSAIRIRRQLEIFECYRFDEPVPPDDIQGYIQLARALDIPICG